MQKGYLGKKMGKIESIRMDSRFRGNDRKGIDIATAMPLVTPAELVPAEAGSRSPEKEEVK